MGFKEFFKWITANKNKKAELVDSENPVYEYYLSRLPENKKKEITNTNIGFSKHPGYYYNPYHSESSESIKSSKSSKKNKPSNTINVPDESGKFFKDEKKTLGGRRRSNKTSKKKK
jgi:hypothetical protein